MDDVPGLQTIAAGNLGLARGAASERAALREQLRPRRTMDRPVDSATAEQRRIGGVDDGVDVEGGDVGFKDLDTVRHGNLATFDTRIRRELTNMQSEAKNKRLRIRLSSIGRRGRQHLPRSRLSSMPLACVDGRSSIRLRLQLVAIETFRYLERYRSLTARSKLFLYLVLSGLRSLWTYSELSACWQIFFEASPCSVGPRGGCLRRHHSS